MDLDLSQPWAPRFSGSFYGARPGFSINSAREHPDSSTSPLLALALSIPPLNLSRLLSIYLKIKDI